MMMVVTPAFAAPGGTSPVAPDPAECAASGGVIEGTLCIPSSQHTGLADTEVSTIVDNVLGFIVLMFGGIAMIAIIVCGITYLFAAGDKARAEDAKRCLLWSIIGIVIVSLAMVILKTIASFFL